MRKIFRFLALAVMMTVILTSTVFAANDFPSPTSVFFVNDFADVLSNETESKIAQIGKRLEDKTTAQVVLVTINTLDGGNVDSYANKLFENWEIGQKGKDNGVLILYANAERMLRIEVGYGLEGALTDIESNIIIRDYVSPHTKEKNDFDSGLLSGYAAAVQQVAEEYGAEIELGFEQPNISGATRNSPNRRDERGFNFAPVLFVVFLILDAVFFKFRITSTIIKIFFWSSMFRGGRGGRGGWGGGGFGGGGFGGGGFGGGGGRSGGGGSSGGI